MTCNIYKNGSYLHKNPEWDVDDSPWKAKNILKIIQRNSIFPNTVCEIGCGAGEILRQLRENMNGVTFYGYEVSPQAFKLCNARTSDRLHFKLKDILEEEKIFFDVILMIDVIEHIEDYLGFLRKTRSLSTYKIFHFPLDLSVQSVIRSSPILKNRENVGHIHYFTKDLALQILKDTGYEVIDFFYTPTTLELKVRSFKSYLMRLPRRIFFAINEDMAVRVFGGYSLLVLAK